MEVESAQAEDGEEVRLRTLTERALRPMSGRNGGVGILKGRNGEIQAKDGEQWCLER